MENGINFFRGKDDINYFLNGRQPYFKKMEDNIETYDIFNFKSNQQKQFKCWDK